MWGMDHFRTFDGFEFTFSGKCNYKVAGYSDWMVQMQPINCFNWQTCSKKLVMVFEEAVFTANRDTLLHGDSPVTSKLSISLKSNAEIQIYKQDTFWYLLYSSGVRVKWNNESWVFISLENNFMEKTNGICGDFNDVLNDDLRLRDKTISSSVDEFGNDWRLDSQCPLANTSDPCVSVSLRQRGENACLSILDEKWDKCSNRETYYRYCIWDYCIASNSSVNPEVAVCQAFEAFSKKCFDNGVTVSWRNSTFCRKL
jgi:hypothetical protein